MVPGFARPPPGVLDQAPLEGAHALLRGVLDPAESFLRLKSWNKRSESGEAEFESTAVESSAYDRELSEGVVEPAGALVGQAPVGVEHTDLPRALVRTCTLANLEKHLARLREPNEPVSIPSPPTDARAPRAPLTCRNRPAAKSSSFPSATGALLLPLRCFSTAETPLR